MRAAFALLPVLALAACASAPTPPQLPGPLQPPAGQVLYLEALARGVQIYDCAAKPDGSGLAWTFRAPEASLYDRAGKPLGKHYAGPTWESQDGSRVVGEVKAREPGPDVKAIPWLLLAAKSNNGSGVFADAKSILRVATDGGIAPPAADCTAAGQDLRVFYTATYYFYR